MKKPILRLWAAGAFCSMASVVRADGFLVSPHRPTISGVYTVLHHHVDIKLEDQMSKVQVSQAFHNPSSQLLEVEYFFPLPEDAAIDNFMMLVDGKEMAGKLMGRDEARRIYEGIVRQKKDPALLEYMGRGLFKTSVFPIPAGQHRQVNISYTRLCKREGSTIGLTYPLGTEKYSAQPVGELRIDCRISDKQPIKSVYSPTHNITVSRPSETSAVVSLLERQVLPRDDFSLFYGVDDADIGLTMLTYRPTTGEAGYFLLLASPRVEGGAAVLPKSVIFVLDKSGSMTGQKIEQAARSLRFVLNNLNPGDLFNIVTYDSDVSSFKPELQPCAGGSIQEALAFVDRIAAGGSTNIDGALRTAMGMLSVSERPSYIIFLTDGLPTAGETREPSIVQNCSAGNRVRARLMAFGVGDDVNARLLDKLTAGNFGQSHYVRPSEDIEGPVSKLYSALSSPVMSAPRLDFSGLDAGRTYPTSLPDLFKGNQLVVVGRYHSGGEAEVRLSGRVGDREQVITQRVVLDDGRARYEHAFVEKLWAERRIGHLIDEIDLHGQNRELVDEIVRLSTRYGILTPYTSFLADERVDFARLPVTVPMAADRLSRLDAEESGAGGVAQRVSKGKRMRKSAPAAQGYQYAEDERGEQQLTQTVFNVGLKTFYRKQNRWLDSTVTPEQEKQATRLVQYSDEHFEVMRQLPATMNQYFTLDGEVVVNLNGQTYQVVPQ